MSDCFQLSSHDLRMNSHFTQRNWNRNEFHTIFLPLPIHKQPQKTQLISSNPHQRRTLQLVIYEKRQVELFITLYCGPLLVAT